MFHRGVLGLRLVGRLHERRRAAVAHALGFALYGYGLASSDAGPVRALEALRRGLVIAQDCGNRYIEANLATALSPIEAEHGDPLAALDHMTLGIRNFYCGRFAGVDALKISVVRRGTSTNRVNKLPLIR